MPRTSSRAERSRRVKLLKAAGGGSNDDESSNGASVAAQAKLNHDIASLHNKPKAGRGADAATGKKGSRRSSTPASAPGASSASASFPGGGGSIDAGKKRPRSESCEAVDGSSEAPDAKVDQLVATIEKHDRFFSTMLDMIPEHLVLPAKEVPLSSYSSKYMKVKFIG